MAARHRMYLWAGAMMALSWLSIALVQLHPTDVIAIGYLLGSLSAQVTLAAAWAALAPSPLARRLIVSVGWIFSLWVAVGISMAISSAPGSIMLVVGVLLIVQWLLLQLPLWSLVLGLNLQLRHYEEADVEARTVDLRFGVRHLFIIMSIAGLLLGAGRVLVPLIDMSGGRDIPIFVFLAVAGVVMTFPLLIATLMQRMALPGALLSLMFVGVATVGEIPLFQQLGGRGPNAYHFIAINTVSAAVVLVITAAVRLNGYSLQTKPQLADA